MARNQPNDSSSSSSEAPGSLDANGLTSADMDPTGIDDDLSPSGRPPPSSAREGARAAQKTVKSIRSSTDSSSDPSPISMAKKRRNQSG